MLTTHLAFLRGINVGGNSMIAMADLRACVERLGHGAVRTYINSGNVIFSADDAATDALATTLEAAIERDTGVSTKVLVMTAARFLSIANALPEDWGNTDTMRCDILLLWSAIDEQGILAQLPLNPDVDEVRYTPGAVFWRFERANAGRSRMNRLVGTPLYRLISIRNANTIRRLAGLVSP